MASKIFTGNILIIHLAIVICIGTFANASFNGDNTMPKPFQDECVSGTYPSKLDASVPTHIVNLDLPPAERWIGPLKGKGPGIANLISQLKKVLLSWSDHAQYIIDLMETDLGYLADTFPAPFGEEIKGISKATGVTLSEVVLYNIFYEVFTFCTSVVAQDDSGKLYHGRNLDFGLFMGWNAVNHTWAITEALRPLIANYDFRRDNKTVFKAVIFAGYVGVLNGVKPQTFTFSINERFNVDGGYIGVIKWILGDRDSRWMGFLTRAVMENATSYVEAQNMLAKTPMLAPAYFILAGNKSGEACVITRARASALDVLQMNRTAGDWYLVQTNYDHWEKPLFFDDRRTPCKKCLDRKTQATVGFSSMYDVLHSKPVRNKETAYTALMQVNSGAMETYLQDCPDPCWPF